MEMVSEESLEFGAAVAGRAEEMAGAGKDANQIASILCGEDPEGRNYGIGVVLGGDGKPVAGSPTLKKWLLREVEENTAGTYLNSTKIHARATEAVLSWLRIPEASWGDFIMVTPSDSGTGAVTSGIDTLRIVYPGYGSLGVEERGWAVYKTMAEVKAMGFSEYADDAVIGGEGELPAYQLGPLNTTGRIRGADIWEKRANDAAAKGTPVMLDRAYPGYDTAGSLLEGASYDDAMTASISSLVPFLEAGVTFALAVSPTKSFITFNNRPCGFLLIHCPSRDIRAKLEKEANKVIRARGSAFEHPASRALIKALTEDLSALEREHAGALMRVAEANAAWARHTEGSALAPLFTGKYAGIFRNFPVRPGAAAALYGARLYPVFAGGWMRINTSGLPSDEGKARGEALAFAGQASV